MAVRALIPPVRPGALLRRHADQRGVGGLSRSHAPGTAAGGPGLSLCRGTGRLDPAKALRQPFLALFVTVSCLISSRGPISRGVRRTLSQDREEQEALLMYTECRKTRGSMSCVQLRSTDRLSHVTRRFPAIGSSANHSKAVPFLPISSQIIVCVGHDHVGSGITTENAYALMKLHIQLPSELVDLNHYPVYLHASGISGGQAFRMPDCVPLAAGRVCLSGSRPWSGRWP